jgi:hypothetical protein
MNRTKLRQIDALQDQMLPLVREAFEAARPAVWEKDGNTCTFRPELIGGPLKNYLEELIERKAITSWKFDIEKSWDEYHVVIHYRYRQKPPNPLPQPDQCRTIRFKLP